MAFAAFIPLITAGLNAIMGMDKGKEFAPIQRGSSVNTPKTEDTNASIMEMGQAAGSAFGGSQSTPKTNVGSWSGPDTGQMQPGAADTAMTRRMGLIGESPEKQVSDARIAISTASPEIQREYAPSLDKAWRLIQASKKGSLYGSSSPTTYA